MHQYLISYVIEENLVSYIIEEVKVVMIESESPAKRFLFWFSHRKFNATNLILQLYHRAKRQEKQYHLALQNYRPMQVFSSERMIIRRTWLISLRRVELNPFQPCQKIFFGLLNHNGVARVSCAPGQTKILRPLCFTIL